MADDCFNKITGLDDETKKKIFGDVQVPKDVLRRFVDDIEAIKRASAEDPKLGSFQSRVSEYVKRQREFNKVTKEVRKQDLLKLKALNDFVKQPAFKGDVPKAIIAKLTFMSELANGGRDSAQYRGLAIHEKILTLLRAQLAKTPGDMKLLMSGQLDKEIGIEAEAFSKNEGMGRSKSPEAQRIGKAIFDVNRAMMREHLNSGIPLGDMAGYVAPLTHDVASVRAAGEEKWIADVSSNPYLDKKATFGDSAGDAAAEKEILKSMYKGVSLGKAGTKTALTVDSFDEMAYGQNLATRLTKSREIRFTQYEGQHAYNELYGKSSLLNTIESNIQTKSRALGLVQIFGSNPELQIMKALSTNQAELRRAGNFDAADAIKRETQNVMFRYHELAGRSSAPGNNTLDKIGSTVRSINVLSKLFNVALRKIIDFPTSAMAIKTYTGQNFFESLGSTIKNFSGSVKDNMTSRHVGEFFSNLAAEMSNGDKTVMSKLTRLQMEVNGINKLSSHIEEAYARTFQGIMGENAGKDFKSLNPRIQASLLSIGVSESDWPHLSKGIETAADGKTYLTQEGIGKIDQASVKERVKELNQQTKGLKMNPERYINDLQNKYYGLVLRGGENSANVAGAEERAVLNRGTYRGELWGEVARLGTQFKSFWVKSFNNTMVAMNANPDKALLAKGILQSGPKDFVTPAQWITMASAFSYVGQSLIGATHGQNPEDPRHVDTWVKALAHSGAGGMLFELTGSSPQYGMAENILGPTFGQLFGPGAKLIGQGREDLEKGKMSKTFTNMAVRLARNNIPFQQAPGVSELLNSVSDNIQESLTPGYKAKKSIKTILEDRKNRVNLFGQGGG